MSLILSREKKAINKVQTTVIETDAVINANKDASKSIEKNFQTNIKPDIAELRFTTKSTKNRTNVLHLLVDSVVEQRQNQVSIY